MQVRAHTPSIQILVLPGEPVALQVLEVGRPTDGSSFASMSAGDVFEALIALVDGIGNRVISTIENVNEMQVPTDY